MLSRNWSSPQNNCNLLKAPFKVHVQGYVTLKTTFWYRENSKTIKVKYLVINSPNSYNIIIGRPTFNLLGVFLSTKFLIMKYTLEKGKTRMIREGQKIARECYHNNLRLQKGKKKEKAEDKPLSVNMIDLDPREEYHQEHIEPTEELKEVLIGSEPRQVTKLGTSLSPDEELTLTQLLKNNLDLFAWKPSNMPRIDPNIVCHHLVVNPSVKPMVQRKRNLDQAKINSHNFASTTVVDFCKNLGI